jgi:hypothetical protein
MSTYRVILTASRDLINPAPVEEQLSICLDTAVALERTLILVHGHCRTGGDAFGDAWAVSVKRQGWPVEVERHPAQNHPTQDFGPWPGCGPKRNNFMVGLGAAECLAFVGPCTSIRCQRKTPHGSHGASGCADAAKRAGIDVKRWDLWRTS